MKYLFVANWKMQMPVKKAIAYVADNLMSLKSMANDNAQIVICPSFVAIASIAQVLKNCSVRCGAQDCSAFENGAYTGQVAAQSLAEIGCSYCIIGHSERRIYCGESSESVAEKAQRLLDQEIIPIICIGETMVDCVATSTYTVLEEQLDPVFTLLRTHTIHNTALVIAYEPVWAIGSGVTPEYSYLENIFDWLRKLIQQNVPNRSVSLLYGGSVNERSIMKLKNITQLNGFLIGGASTDFTQFKTIVELCTRSIL